ncbi:MAG: ImpA family metalloprotease, partial [Epsilonproteobacteria bacterium]|nr:ImpA family metalloprotease [Campylobacterota bacterium]
QASSYRLNGASVYISNTSYNGVLDESQKVGTLEGNAEKQYIEFTDAHSGTYLIIKGKESNHLHLSTVEVYGQAPATPSFVEHEREFLIKGTSDIGDTIVTLEAMDYQDDVIRYSVDNPAFSADNQGNIKVNSVLQAGAYNVMVTISDGLHTATTNLTINVTSNTAIEDALASGSVLNVTEEELIQATRDEIATLRAGNSLLSVLYKDEAIAYNPGNRNQLINIKGDAHKIFPILQGNKGKTLAAAGTKVNSRFAAFGAAPMEHFQDGDNLSYEPQFKRLLAWLIMANTEDTLDSNKTIGLSFTHADKSDIKAWIASNYPKWTVQECDRTSPDFDTCYNNVDLIITGWQTDESNTQMVRAKLEEVVTAGTPVLYLHTWYEAYNSVAHSIANLFGFELPYGGNYWSKDAVAWDNVEAMQLSVFSGLGYDSIDTMLAHFQDKDYNFDWNQCTDGKGAFGSQYDKCGDVIGLNSEFQEGATKVRGMMTGLDSSKKNIFSTTDYRLQKLLALVGDKFRQSVTFPMDKVTTDDNEFMKSYYSDHAVYNYRAINPAQKDMGNFSRSDFSHIIPTTKTVTLTSKKSFRSTGAYALPGQTVKVTRNDSSAVNVKVFINTLRSGATHQYQKNSSYNRPKYLQTPHFEIKSGESIELTSPYGGTLQLEFDTNDLDVSVTFENVGEHAYWASSADDASFTQKLNAGDFDWAEVVTNGFEVHSKLDKMRKSVADEKWGTAEALAAATKRYMSNFPHVLAGFRGAGIDVVDEIHDFATTNGLTIETLDKVKHMNADQATCGYGCSGNPYDAYWAFSPVGHGDVHELGHGLQKGRFQYEGFENHSMTNPYSYYTKSKYNETIGSNGTDCQNLPFKEVFEKLQASVNEANATAYLKTNLWDSSGWSQQFMVTLQAMMHTQKMGKLENGWHLWARVHILEREISRADDDWENRKASIGFSDYTLDEFKAMRKNDWLLVSISFASGLDFRDYLTMMGIEYSQKASDQVASFAYTMVPKKFFVSTSNGYCKSDDTYGSFLDKSMLDVDGTTAFPY